MNQGDQIKVLDLGFIRLVDSMGGDGAVVQSARVSYGRGTKTPDEDSKLIAYLLKHLHGTPFEQAVFKFHVKCPIFVARQWFRHRMSSYNEYSGRYSEMKNEFYIPTLWRTQDGKNKQGSVVKGDLDHKFWSSNLRDHCELSMKFYHRMLENGIAKEMARFALPLNLYTEFYWTVNARALMHFIGLRSDEHAQLETRQYSDALFEFFSREMPWTAAAFLRLISNPLAYSGIMGCLDTLAAGEVADRG